MWWHGPLCLEPKHLQIPVLLFNSLSILGSYLTSLGLSFPTEGKVGITLYVLSSGGEDFNWLIHVKFLEVSGAKCYIHVRKI